MGLRGKPPTPTAILKLRGSWRAKLNPAEPQPPSGEPDKPKLTTVQRRVWHQLVDQLAGMDLLRRTDGWQLERYCVYFVKWRDTERMLADGTLDDDRRERLESRSFRLHDALRQIESQFGLTPASRTRIRLEPRGNVQAPSRFFRKDA